MLAEVHLGEVLLSADIVHLILLPRVRYRKVHIRHHSLDHRILPIELVAHELGVSHYTLVS